jgi:Xaa-Pro aminopeptidase
VLEAGMVLSVESPYNEAGFGGMIVEETVVLTETGCEQITSIPSEIYIV